MGSNIKYNSLIIDGKLIEITGENVSIKIREVTEKEIEEHDRNNKKDTIFKAFDYLRFEKNMN